VYLEGELVDIDDYTVGPTQNNGRWYTAITFDDDPGEDAVISCDVYGIEDEGDGTGEMISDPPAQIAHYLTNFCFGNWRQGSWDALSPRIDATSFASTFWADREIEGSRLIAVQSDGHGIIAEWCASNNARCFWAPDGKLRLVPMDPTQTWETYQEGTFLRWERNLLSPAPGAQEDFEKTSSVSASYLYARDKYNGTIKVQGAAAHETDDQPQRIELAWSPAFGWAWEGESWSAEEPVDWDDLINCDDLGSGTLHKNAGGDAYNAGAHGAQEIPSVGYVKFQVISQSSYLTVCGLSNGEMAAGDPTKIDFGIRVYNPNAEEHYAQAIESGALKGSPVTHHDGNIYKVACEVGGVIKYYVNDTLLYTSIATPAFPLVVDATIYSLDGNVHFAQISGVAVRAPAQHEQARALASLHRWWKRGQPTYYTVTVDLDIGQGLMPGDRISVSYYDAPDPSDAGWMWNADKNGWLLIEELGEDPSVEKITLKLLDLRPYLVLFRDTAWADQSESVLADGVERIDKGCTRTFTRASPAYFYRPGDGKVTRADNDVEAHAFAGDLSEGASTNRILNSALKDWTGTTCDHWTLSGSGTIEKVSEALDDYEDAILWDINVVPDTLLLKANGTITTRVELASEQIIIPPDTIGCVAIHHDDQTAGGYLYVIIRRGDGYYWDDTAEDWSATEVLNSLGSGGFWGGELWRSKAIAIGSGETGFTEDVIWSNMTNCSAVGNTITKNAGGNAWNGCGRSAPAQEINSGDGYVTFKQGYTHEANVGMIGLNVGAQCGGDYSLLDFAFYLYHSGESRIAVFENGSNKYSEVFDASKTYKIAIESGVVKYYKDTTLLYTSATAPTYPLYADVAMYGITFHIDNVIISAAGGGDPTLTITPCIPTTGVPYQWHLLQYVAWEDRPYPGSYIVTEDVAGEREASRLLISNNLVTGSSEAITYEGTANYEITDNDVTKDAGGDGWNAYGNSVQEIASGDGYVTFAVPMMENEEGQIFCGLNAGAACAGDGSVINFAFEVWRMSLGNHYCRIVESGVTKLGWTAYTPGQTLKIAIEEGQIKYYRDATLLYLSATAPTYPLFLDNAIYHQGDSILDAIVGSVGVGGDPIPKRCYRGAFGAWYCQTRTYWDYDEVAGEIKTVYYAEWDADNWDWVRYNGTEERWEFVRSVASVEYTAHIAGTPQRICDDKNNALICDDLYVQWIGAAGEQGLAPWTIRIGLNGAWGNGVVAAEPQETDAADLEIGSADNADHFDGQIRIRQIYQWCPSMFEMKQYAIL
jgi:hypothetical protein